MHKILAGFLADRMDQRWLLVATFGAAIGWTCALVQGFAIIATRFIGFVYDLTHGYVSAFASFLVISSGVLAFTLLFGFKPGKPACA